jgi:hypothetical protein
MDLWTPPFSGKYIDEVTAGRQLAPRLTKDVGLAMNWARRASGDSGGFSLPELVQRHLTLQRCPCKTLDIAQAVGLQTAKDVNPALYTLQKERLVWKAAGHPPKWMISAGGGFVPGDHGAAAGPGGTDSESETRICSSVPEYDLDEAPTRATGPGHMQTSLDVDAKVLAYLSKLPNSTASAKDIAKGLGLQSKKAINRDLYNMGRDGLIERVNESPPTWKLIPVSQSQQDEDEDEEDEEEVKKCTPADASKWHVHER